jgi:hypothetical protein
MQYVVQRRKPLGGLEWIAEFDDLNEAKDKVIEMNRNRPVYLKSYPAYIFDTLNYRAIHIKRNNHPYWCVWVGGSSYSVGEPEYFGSIEAIKDELRERLNNQRRYPCVDESSYFECYAGEMSDYPDFIIKFGKRGAPIKERC